MLRQIPYAETLENVRTVGRFLPPQFDRIIGFLDAGAVRDHCEEGGSGGA